MKKKKKTLKTTINKKIFLKLTTTTIKIYLIFLIINQHQIKITFHQINFFLIHPNYQQQQQIIIQIKN